MKKYFIITLGIVMFSLQSCQNKQEQLKNKIETQEKAVYDKKDELPKNEDIQSLLDSYLKYTNSFPKDTLTPDYYYRAAELELLLDKPDKSIEYYNEIIKNHPDYPKQSQILFLKAFVYENHLHDIPNAKKYYEEFLRKYPDNEFADDVRTVIDNLGKSPEELIKEFEEKNKE